MTRSIERHERKQQPDNLWIRFGISTSRSSVDPKFRMIEIPSKSIRNGERKEKWRLFPSTEIVKIGVPQKTKPSILSN
jgi:hypothetical protein